MTRTDTVMSMIDGAWATYRSLSLPPPSPSRLIVRGSVPSDRLSFFREHYRIPADVSISVSHMNLPNPGHVVVRSRRYFEIAINSSYMGWHDAEAAVMAHEMSHVVMKVHGFRSPDLFMEEVYTDSFAVFLGSCLLSNFSESVDFYGSRSLSMRLGYLEPRDRAYAVAVFLRAAGIRPPLHPSGPWRRADIEGLDAAVRNVASREEASLCAPRPPGLECPRCGTQVVSSTPVRYCGLCLSSWKKTFWGWRPSAPPPSALESMGLLA